MRDEIEVPQRLHRGHAAVRDFPVVNYGLRSHYWFPHVPLALLLAVAGYWMLRASFGTHWPEYLKMLAEGTFRLELKRLPPLLIGTGMITMALGLLWRSRLAWVMAVLLAAMLLSGEQVTPEFVMQRVFQQVSPPRPSPLMRSHRRMQGVAGTSGARLDDVTRRGPDSSSYWCCAKQTYSYCAQQKGTAMDDPFLAPIEEPEGLMLKLAYFFTRRQFGKVLTPLKVHSARLPPAFGLFYAKIGRLDKKLLLPPETAMLIREQVARINVCLFCMDIGRSFTIKASMKQAKFDALEQYRTSPLFTDAERAALDYVTELTKERKVNPDTFARMAGYYSEREICEIVWLVASEHLYNMTNIGLNIHSDMLCDIGRKTN